jgi:hypothetical protein
VDWIMLSMNDNAIQILEENSEKVNWSMMSFNFRAGPLLEANPEKIDWEAVWYNREIFELDYEAMSERIAPIKDELLSVVMHPSRYEHIMKLGL